MTRPVHLLQSDELLRSLVKFPKRSDSKEHYFPLLCQRSNVNEQPCRHCPRRFLHSKQKMQLLPLDNSAASASDVSSSKDRLDITWLLVARFAEWGHCLPLRSPYRWYDQIWHYGSRNEYKFPYNFITCLIQFYDFITTKKHFPLPYLRSVELIEI